MSIKENIRNKKRYERSLLSDAHLARLSDNFLTQWMKFSKELSYQSIAIYYPFDNEDSPLEIFNYLFSFRIKSTCKFLAIEVSHVEKVNLLS